MKKIVLAVAVSALFAHSAAAQTTCSGQAAERKLHGAALTSFMRKCETDAAAGCERSAQDRKLAGAAKSSFSKKCISDAVGKNG